MSNELLGLDVEASRVLAERLGGWSTRGEEIRLVLVEAELLSDIPTGVVGLVDEIGGDGAAMAAAIRVAADALALFTIELESPRLIAGAVASIHAFSGRANGPELPVFAPVPCHNLPSKTINVPALASAFNIG